MNARLISVSPKLVHQENSDTKEIEKPKQEREECVPAFPLFGPINNIKIIIMSRNSNNTYTSDFKQNSPWFYTSLTILT